MAGAWGQKPVLHIAPKPWDHVVSSWPIVNLQTLFGEISQFWAQAKDAPGAENQFSGLESKPEKLGGGALSSEGH